ncbi:MAG: GNAT family N-acetyltransferase, partial [Chloroflexi bacterium]|nr:GNAT family N-acetyltransferase [Chloroflexota bacterium]
KRAYLVSLVAPLDVYWQAAIIDPAPHWEMVADGRSLGYFAADEKKRLLQFYASDRAAELFAAVIGSEWVETAVAGTNDPAFLSLCLDVQKQVSVNTYLFHDARQVDPALPTYPWATFRLSTERDLERLLAFYGRNDEFSDSDAIEANFGGQRSFIQSLIANQQSFILMDGDTLLGIGECRVSASQPPYADIGMIVDKDHRRRGVGASILARLKAHCASQNAIPICSCAADNFVSRKTIEKAGFAAHHRMLDILL